MRGTHPSPSRSAARDVRDRLSYSNVVATAALFVALGGTSYAVLRVGSEDVIDNSLRSKDVRNNTLRSRDIRDSTILGQDVLVTAWVQEL